MNADDNDADDNDDADDADDNDAAADDDDDDDAADDDDDDDDDADDADDDADADDDDDDDAAAAADDDDDETRLQHVPLSTSFPSCPTSSENSSDRFSFSRICEGFKSNEPMQHDCHMYFTCFNQHWEISS